MPAGNLHCFDCGADLARPAARQRLRPGPAVPGDRTQAEAFTFYRPEVPRLAAAGWYPIAHSWGDEPAGFGFAAPSETRCRPAVDGTLMVTYRQEGHA